MPISTPKPTRSTTTKRPVDAWWRWPRPSPAVEPAPESGLQVDGVEPEFDFAIAPQLELDPSQWTFGDDLSVTALERYLETRDFWMLPPGRRARAYHHLKEEALTNPGLNKVMTAWEYRYGDTEAQVEAMEADDPGHFLGEQLRHRRGQARPSPSVEPRSSPHGMDAAG